MNWFLIWASGAAVAGFFYGVVSPPAYYQKNLGTIALSVALWPVCLPIDLPLWVAQKVRRFLS